MVKMKMNKAKADSRIEIEREGENLNICLKDDFVCYDYDMTLVIL